MATLCAFRHVMSSASGSGCPASKDNAAEENAQFFLSSIRAPSTMQMASATMAPEASCHNRSEMAVARPKKVTDPLNESVRARLRGDCDPPMNAQCGSSGSEHGPNSARLADMVYDFMEEEDDAEEEDEDQGKKKLESCSRSISEADVVASHSSAAEGDSSTFLGPDLKDVLENLVYCSKINAVEGLLHKEAMKAVEMFEANQNQAECYQGCKNQKENGDEMTQKSFLRRYVMKHLRVLGYNAGICKSRWEHTGGFPAGDYEYIDVIVDGRERFFVDIDFRAEFEIARPSSQYHALLQILPRIFVTKVDILKRIIKIMCDSAKRSLKKGGMHLPPWRKHRYMQAKWFGPYKRTTNSVPISSYGCPNAFLATALGSIALKGRGWDYGFKHQMELHYEISIRESFKWKEMQSHTLQTNYGDEIDMEWMPPAVTPRRACRERDGKVSGLACALNEAGLTCFSRLQNTQRA
uniref:TSA: Wollemia nobilis Ref_Wollemi_Transcript_25156_2068 transcribed RNA sequence n=1 Tax=Wollemia nobilis TaxID=56998 RepID=A0A0C9RGZ2_9CONI